MIARVFDVVLSGLVAAGLIGLAVGLFALLLDIFAREVAASREEGDQDGR